MNSVFFCNYMFLFFYFVFTWFKRDATLSFILISIKDMLHQYIDDIATYKSISCSNISLLQTAVDKVKD